MKLNNFFGWRIFELFYSYVLKIGKFRAWAAVILLLEFFYSIENNRVQTFPGISEYSGLLKLKSHARFWANTSLYFLPENTERFKNSK